MRRRIHRPALPAGMPITNAVTAHPLRARDIVRVTEQDAVWLMLDDPERRRFRDWVSRLVETDALVWLEHYDADLVATVEAALKNANVPVGRIQHNVDKLVAEAVVSAPSQQDLKVSIRDAVTALIDELCRDNVTVSCDLLSELVMGALEKAGVL